MPLLGLFCCISHQSRLFSIIMISSLLYYPNDAIVAKCDDLIGLCWRCVKHLLMFWLWLVFKRLGEGPHFLTQQAG